MIHQKSWQFIVAALLTLNPAILGEGLDQYNVFTGIQRDGRVLTTSEDRGTETERETQINVLISNGPHLLYAFLLKFSMMLEPGR